MNHQEKIIVGYLYKDLLSGESLPERITDTLMNYVLGNNPIEPDLKQMSLEYLDGKINPTQLEMIRYLPIKDPKFRPFRIVSEVSFISQQDIYKLMDDHETNLLKDLSFEYFTTEDKEHYQAKRYDDLSYKAIWSIAYHLIERTSNREGRLLLLACKPT